MAPWIGLDRVARRGGEITMAKVRSKSGPGQPLRHLDCRGDRAVSSSCASERNGHVTFSSGPVAGNPIVEKRFDAAHRLSPGRVLRKVVPHRRVLARERTELV